MQILALNCGSSTLKFKVFEMGEDIPPGKERRMAHGVVERIGGLGTIKFIAESGECLQKTEVVTDHFGATRQVIGWLRSLGFLEQDGLKAVGHRVVHGGHRFAGPALIDDEVIDGIEALRYLAPLHNEPSLMAIRATREVLGSTIPMVAVFEPLFTTRCLSGHPVMPSLRIGRQTGCTVVDFACRHK